MNWKDPKEIRELFVTKDSTKEKLASAKKIAWKTTKYAAVGVTGFSAGVVAGAALFFYIQEM